MIYKNYDCNSYNIYTIKTDKFKTSHLELIFRQKVKKEDLPSLGFLADMLSESCKEFPSRKELMIKYEELYKIIVYASDVRIGNVLSFHVSLDFLNPKYINDNNYLENVIKTFFDIVLKPNVKDDEFDLVSFNNVKSRLLREINALEENAFKQCIKRAFKLMDEDSVTSYDLLGSKEDIEAITPYSLYKTYKNLIKNFTSDIFIIGDVDMDYLSNLIKKYYKNRYINEIDLSYYACNKVVKKVKKKEDTSKNVQSNLAMIFNLDGLTKLEKDITVHVFNYIFGSGGLKSKITQSVREQNSLCYGINSTYLKFDGLLLIHTALESENIEKAINLVKKDLRSMQNGDFSVDDVNDAINNMLVSLDMSNDNSMAILNNYIFKIYDNLPEADERRKLFKSVTKDDVIKVARKIKLNTIFALKGKGE